MGVFIKFTVQTLNTQLSERFTNHQRVPGNITFSKFKFLSRFWVTILGFSHFLSKFQAFSRPGKVNDKIPAFQGRVQTMWCYFTHTCTMLQNYTRTLSVILFVLLTIFVNRFFHHFGFDMCIGSSHWVRYAILWGGGEWIINIWYGLIIDRATSISLHISLSIVIWVIWSRLWLLWTIIMVWWPSTGSGFFKLFQHDLLLSQEVIFATPTFLANKVKGCSTSRFFFITYKYFVFLYVLWHLLISILFNILNLLICTISNIWSHLTQAWLATPLIDCLHLSVVQPSLQA